VDLLPAFHGQPDDIVRDLPFGVLYFNVTPPMFFDRWEPAAADNLRGALADVRRLASTSRFAIANTKFSEGDLTAAGYSPTAVCPVVFDLKELESPANDRLVQRLRRETDGGGHRWMFLGRLAPNKCQHDLIASFAAYRDLFDPRARLTIVGGKTSTVYYRSLELLTEELEVADAVEFTDAISHEEKLAIYQASDVFVCLSEHEGFMVPVVEAMHLGVPVVAYAATAVTETVGDAGVLLSAKDPVLVATAVNRVLTDGPLRSDLVESGRRRAQHFSLERSTRSLLDTLDRFVR
jgi:glycosyltransferase involved in cell wall biosynthesis